MLWCLDSKYCVYWGKYIVGSCLYIFQIFFYNDYFVSSFYFSLLLQCHVINVKCLPMEVAESKKNKLENGENGIDIPHPSLDGLLVDFYGSQYQFRINQ